MAISDPHGWTLTVVSVSVVFSSLAILFFIFQILGGYMSGRYGSRREERKASKVVKGVSADEETAAAIALALMLNGGNEEETAAAIALALHLSSGMTHDSESFTITFPTQGGPWSDKSLTLRKYSSK